MTPTPPPSGADPQDLTLFLAQSVVEQPSQVRVSRRAGNLLVRVAPGEEGRLIGRQGRVIQAIRTLVRSLESAERLNVDLDAPGRDGAERAGERHR